MPILHPTRTLDTRRREGALSLQPRSCRGRAPRLRRPAVVRSSSQLEGAEREECAEYPENPEAHHDLALVPAALLEMVVKRRQPEHPVRLCVFQPFRFLVNLEHHSLKDHRYHLRDEHTAHQQQHEFGLEENRYCTERAAERQRARITHEDLRRMGVEPEKSYTRAHDCRAEHSELPCPPQIENLQIRGCIDAADHIGEQRQSQHRDRSEPGGEAVQTVGDVDGVARSREHERHEENVEPADGGNDEYVLVEWERRRRARQGRQGELPQIPPERDADGELSHQLVALDEPGVLLSCLPLLELEKIVEEADESHPQHHEHPDQDVSVIELRPEDGRNERSGKNDQAAHGWRALLLLVTVGRALPDYLVKPHAPQTPDDQRTDNERNEQSCDRGTGGAERYVVEDPQESEVLYQRNQQVVEH